MNKRVNTAKEIIAELTDNVEIPESWKPSSCLGYGNLKIRLYYPNRGKSTYLRRKRYKFKPISPKEQHPFGAEKQF